MKKLILSAIACFVIVLSSCNQNSPTPSPATPATPTPTPNTIALTHQDSLLLGNWILDKKEQIMNGTMMAGYPQLFNDPINAKMEFKTTIWPGSVNGLKECNDGLTNTGQVFLNGWLPSSNLTITLNNGVISIQLINATNLVLQRGSVSSPGTYGTIYYLHK